MLKEGIGIFDNKVWNEKLDALRKEACTTCQNRGKNDCRYCALGDEKKVWWQQAKKGER